jgi:hypothetical protein
MLSLKHQSLLSKAQTIICIFLLMNMLNVAAVFAQSDGCMTLNLSAEEYSILKSDTGFNVIEMDGFSPLLSPGDPSLPHRVFEILLPQDADPSSLTMTIISAKERPLEGRFNIEPAGPIVAQTHGSSSSPYWGNGKKIVNGRNIAVYENDTNFPAQFVSMYGPSQMRKWKYVPVDFIPFEYNPVSGSLTLIENVTIQICYNKIAPTAEYEQSSAALRDDTAMDDVAPGFFYNYAAFKGSYQPTGNIEAAGKETYDYVIITANQTKNSSANLSNFVTHKQSLGYRVLVVTENDFGSLIGQAPNHRAEKIRKWLKDNYLTKGIKYVLLIGDPNPYINATFEGDIPMKMCYPVDNSSNLTSGNAVPTDFFYAELNGNWDLNGNGYFGEKNDMGIGGLDLCADVYVGRIPVYGKDYATLDKILKKTIDYESSKDIDWRRNALLPMAFSDNRTDGAYLAEQMKSDYLNSQGYTNWTMYQMKPNLCNIRSNFIGKEEIQNETAVMNRWTAQRFGIVSWWGHGDSNSANWGYGSCGSGNIFNSTQASNLNNRYPSFTYQCSCTNGYPEESDNLQYQILKNGGIATVGATRYSLYSMGQKSFHEALSGPGIGYEYLKRIAQDEMPAGDALYQTKTKFISWDNSWANNYYDFNIYGDPSVSISAANLPNMPMTPQGRKHVTALENSTFSTNESSSSGGSVFYAFDWGDGKSDTTNWISSGGVASLSHAWNSYGSYKIKARAINRRGMESAWSSPMTVVVEAGNPGTPTQPRGPVSVLVGRSATYETSAIDPGNLDLDYVFDWGDDSANWTETVMSGKKVSLAHIWTRAGTYDVKTYAQNTRNNQSTYSTVLKVTVNSANPPSKPAKLKGNDRGFVGRITYFSTYAKDPGNLNVKYTFNWEDGTPDSSTGFVRSGMPARENHIWKKAGVYQVTAWATNSKGDKSDLSEPHIVRIKPWSK